MKTSLLLLGVTLVLLSFKPSTQQVDIQKASEQRLIMATFSGRSASTHYLKPLTATVRNLKNQVLEISVPAGYHFKSDDSTVQDIITTQEEMFVLNPGEEKEIALSGMCIQHYNGSPGDEDGFKLAGWADDGVKKLATFIAANNFQNYQGQQAMWVVSDGEELRYIVGIGSNSERELIDLVAGITHQPTITEAQYAALKRDVVLPIYKAELRGKFVLNFSRKVPVHIALFDENGIVLQEIYNQTAPPGKQEITYTFDALPYEGQTIHAKLIAFDDVLLDRAIVL